MKKNGWILLLFVLIGLLAGALIARWLAPVPGISFLTRSLPLTWTPAFDFYVISFTLTLSLQLSLFSLIGAVFAIWLYRKM